MKFEKADEVRYEEVETWILEYVETTPVSIVSASKLCKRADIENNEYNRHRVREVLDEHFTVSEEWTNPRTTRYKVP